MSRTPDLGNPELGAQALPRTCLGAQAEPPPEEPGSQVVLWDSTGGSLLARMRKAITPGSAGGICRLSCRLPGSPIRCSQSLSLGRDPKSDRHPWGSAARRAPPA